MTGLSAEVIIVGAGVAGTTLAGLLGAKGIECIVIETGARTGLSNSIPTDPRALALTHASKRILESINVWQHLPEDRLGRFDAMHVWDENGSGEIEFDSAELCQPGLGFIVEQSVLQDTLARAVDFISAVSFYYNTSLLDIRQCEDSISVVLDNNEEMSAQLLVGADGAHSLCRELAGIANSVHDYQQVALACLVETRLGHGHIARQRFLRDGPLAFLPMHSEHQCGVVWSTRPEHADSLMQMSENEFNQSLQQAFDYTLGDVSRSMQRGTFPLRRAEAEQYCKERFALIGDAAHSVHPLAGQGANLGLLDAASLAQLVISSKQKNRDPASTRVLRSYERWRKVENKMMMMTLEGFKYGFENQSSPLPLLRNKALDIADSITPLKHIIMRHAMGLSGDLPELAKGNFV